MFDGLRWRLTAWYVGVLAVALGGFAVGAYALLARNLLASADAGLLAFVDTAATSLEHDAAEGQTPLDAARSTVAELSQGHQRLALYDGAGRLLARTAAKHPVDGIALGAAAPAEEAVLVTVAEEDDDDDRHRVALRRVRIEGGATFVIVASRSLEPADDDLESLRRTLLRAVPIALAVAGLGGYLLARQSLRPLAQAFRLQRRFMSDASHELRTPLATIQTAALVSLQSDARPAGEYRQALEIVAGQSRRLTRIVDDMFTLAHGDGREPELRRARFYLDELLADVARSASVLASARGVTVDTQLPPDAEFTGDEDLVRRLATNLVDNAVRHSPAGAPVRLELARDGGSYRITVADRGAGIPESARTRIFDRFFRADDGRARAGGEGTGAGLGLAIARFVAESHGGQLDLVRSGPDGTTFAAVLPVGPA
jgi:signal transduction histidine kinase